LAPGASGGKFTCAIGKLALSSRVIASGPLAELQSDFTGRDGESRRDGGGA
jgi:hypothetical protein